MGLLFCFYARKRELPAVRIETNRLKELKHENPDRLLKKANRGYIIIKDKNYSGLGTIIFPL